MISRYAQLLQDQDEKGSAYVHRIGIEPYSISVGTARIDLVEIALCVHPGPPPAVPGEGEHVVEVDLEVTSGAVSVYGCTEDPGSRRKVGVQPGRYRVRVSYLLSEPPDSEVSSWEQGEHFCYWLDMWQSAKPPGS